MNEEIEYAEMLEIPVSTVNVVRKNRRRKKTTAAMAKSHPSPSADTTQKGDLKDSVIAQVNDKLNLDPQPISPAPNQADTETVLEGNLELDPIPDRMDTVRLYSDTDTENFNNSLFDNPYPTNEIFENDGGRYALNYKNRPSKAMRIAMKAEFAAACVLCGAIFLTNVFMPKSAINTFFRALVDTPAAEETDARLYSDFHLTPVVSNLSDAEFTLSATGVLSFTDDCCVYPLADGNVLSVTKQADDTYTVQLSHSDSFTATVSGLNHVYYQEGEEVRANVPLGYTAGEQEVQVTMYSYGAPLSCFEITEDNGLIWTDATVNEPQNDTQI